MRYAFIFVVFLISCSSPKPQTEAETQPVESTEPKPAIAIEDAMKIEGTTIEKGRIVVDAFYAKKLDELYEKFSSKMQRAMSKEQWEGAHVQITGGLGEETKVVSETDSAIGSIEVYRRQATFKNTGDKVFEVTVALGPDSLLEGFSVTEPQIAAESKFLEYKTKTDLRLPFEEAWNVVWGGRTIEKNYHAKVVDQRFALDLLIMKEGKTHEGDSTKNESYFAFGKKVVSPGKGKIVAVANDIEDNVPGEMNRGNALGNHVIIDHGNGEFSVIAHFKKGSLKVKKGDKVKAGKLLGLCGNSGNSSEPHIHYHLQNSATPFKSEGLPIQFRAFKLNGEPQVNAELEQGNIISP